MKVIFGAFEKRTLTKESRTWEWTRNVDLSAEPLPTIGDEIRCFDITDRLIVRGTVRAREFTYDARDELQDVYVEIDVTSAEPMDETE